MARRARHLGRLRIDPIEVDLYLFREVNAAFILSLVTFAVGFVFYLARMQVRAASPARSRQPAEIRSGLGPDARRAEGAGRMADGSCNRVSAALHGHHLRDARRGRGGHDLAARMRSARSCWTSAEEFDGLLFKHWAVLVFITAGALLTAYTGSRMTAVAALGVVGIGVALIFIMFSAPDVAITQLLVETLTVVLVAVAMLKLPHLNLGREARRPATRCCRLTSGRS
jgi:multicomponent Na+:H+ antiporter subunit A